MKSFYLPMTKQVTEQLDIRFRFQPLPSSPDGVLLKYIKAQGPTFISNEVALKAMRMVWLAQAYQHCGDKKGQELKKLAQNMIYVLEDWINYIRTTFGLDSPPCITAFPSSVSMPLPQVLSSDESESSVEQKSVWSSVKKLEDGGL